MKNDYTAGEQVGCVCLGRLSERVNPGKPGGTKLRVYKWSEGLESDRWNMLKGPILMTGPLAIHDSRAAEAFPGIVTETMMRTGLPSCPFRP